MGSINKSRRVVVTGLGMISCLGAGVQKNWSKLLNNECGLHKLPEEGLLGPCKIGGLVSDSELQQCLTMVIEQQQRIRGVETQIDRRAMSRSSLLAIVAAHEALQQAGWIPRPGEAAWRNYASQDECSFRAGTYLSAGLEGIEAILEASQQMVTQGYRGMGAHILTRVLANMPCGNVSRAWGLRGPTISANTACASGLHSIGGAYRMIQHGEADFVVAGGCEAAVLPWTLAAFSRIRALATGYNDTPQLASRPFDARRQGFVMSEGAAVLILEAWPTPTHLSKQLRRPALHSPLAEILGFGRSADAYGLVSPDPTGDGAFRSMKAAVEDACLLNIDEIDHINCHATSTPLGDATELAAISKLLHHFRRNPNCSPIFLNSIKGHIGHCLGAAGAVEVAYSVLSACKNKNVPNRNLEVPVDPDEVANILSSDGTDKAVVRACVEKLFNVTSFDLHKPSAWKNVADRRRMVLTNSFGFGGTNGSLLISNWLQ